MNIERALTIQGWMSTEELTYLAAAASKSSSIVEVGSWKGRSTYALAANTAGSVVAVDTWLGSEEQGGESCKGIMDEFYANLADYRNINVFQMESLEAAELFALQGCAFDLIFLDARHEYSSIHADILAWRPLVKEGGILCGHDYHPAWPGVVKAVDELIPKFRVVDSIWTTEA